MIFTADLLFWASLLPAVEEPQELKNHPPYSDMVTSITERAHFFFQLWIFLNKNTRLSGRQP
ncbi:MAG: hypothetical protein EA344_01255 [Alkalicoccus sp.]|nr:MAG: hypothetical protein EA344_01255 [Alkalicoccus sp.]